MVLLCAGLQASTSPYGYVQIGEQLTPFTLYNVGTSKLTQLHVDLRSADYSLTGDATVNTDPWIDYGFAFKNLSNADISFTILLYNPYVGGPYDIATSSHSGSVTNSAGVGMPDTSVTVTPPSGGNIHQPNINGVPFAGIEGGCALTGLPLGNSGYCGLGNINGASIMATPGQTLGLTLSATVSPGDIYTFNGFVGITPLSGDTVPEPATFGVAAAAFGLAALLRRRMAA